MAKGGSFGGLAIAVGLLIVLGSTAGAADAGTLGTLSAVAATPGGAIAVGSTREPLCQHGLAESGGTGTWTAVHPPTPPGCSGLNAVAADGHGGAWAVGQYLSNGVSHAFTEHYDGHAWTIVPCPSPGRASGLGGIVVLPNGTAVAVGAYQEASSGLAIGATKTLVEQNAGSGWRVVPSPSPGSNSALNAVAAAPDGRLWAVGHSADPATITHKTLVLSSDAASGWQVIPSPSPPTTVIAGTDLVSVAGGGGAVWAAGRYTDTSNHQRTLTLRSDGHGWSIVPSPTAASATGAGLEAVVVAPDGTAWAAGFSTDAACQHTLTMHFVNGEWQTVESPSPTCTATKGSSLHGLAVDAKGTLYAVGDTNNISTLVLVNRGNGWQVERS